MLLSGYITKPRLIGKLTVATSGLAVDNKLPIMSHIS